MSSIMRWRNGLMGLSVMAITPVSHEVSEPHDLETGRAILFIPTSNPPRRRSRWVSTARAVLSMGRVATVAYRLSSVASNVSDRSLHGAVRLGGDRFKNVERRHRWLHR